MCNSWNHSFECRCGFGGEGHLGRNHGSTRIFESNFLNHRISYESYVNPNAKCPVCREPVFFYQSPYGGRVFFDELGHPWLKHPCTDSSLKNLDVGLSTELNNENTASIIRERNWEKEGWESLVCYELEIDYELYRIRLVGYLSKYSNNFQSSFSIRKDKYEYELYCSSEIPLITLSIKNISKWMQNNCCIFTIYPILIRKNNSENHFELSSFKVDKYSNLIPLYTDEAYMPKTSINDCIPKERQLQKKRVYDGSSEEIEILRKWKVDIKGLMRLKIRTELLANFPNRITREKFIALSEIASKLSNRFNNVEETLNWREIITEIEDEF